MTCKSLFFSVLHNEHDAGCRGVVSECDTLQLIKLMSVALHALTISNNITM
jgi:hypothetical protein